MTTASSITEKLPFSENHYKGESAGVLVHTPGPLESLISFS